MGGGDHHGRGPVGDDAGEAAPVGSPGAGEADGVSSQVARENRDLKRKNAELERTIEILKAATSFFVRESDPRQR